jgi:hypothetical protein
MVSGRGRIDKLPYLGGGVPVWNTSTRVALVAAALAVGAPGSFAASPAAAASGVITMRSTEILKPQDVRDGGVSGTGRFTISGAITDKGTVTDYRKVKGNTALFRRVTVGKKGTITFLTTIQLGTASPAPWTIISGTKAYKGLHGKGTQIVDNHAPTPATFVLKGTVSK